MSGPFAPPFSAAAFWSRRKSDFCLSGPWHGKQLPSKIGRMSLEKSTGSVAGGGNRERSTDAARCRRQRGGHQAQQHEKRRGGNSAEESGRVYGSGMRHWSAHCHSLAINRLRSLGVSRKMLQDWGRPSTALPEIPIETNWCRGAPGHPSRTADDWKFDVNERGRNRRQGCRALPGDGGNPASESHDKAGGGCLIGRQEAALAAQGDHWPKLGAWRDHLLP